MVAEIIVGVIGWFIGYVTYKDVVEGHYCELPTFWVICGVISIMFVWTLNIWSLAIISVIGFALAAKEEVHRKREDREDKNHEELRRKFLEPIGLPRIIINDNDIRKIRNAEVHSRDYKIVDERLTVANNAKPNEEFSKLDDKSKEYLENCIKDSFEGTKELLGRFLHLEYVDIAISLRNKYLGYAASFHRMRAYPKAFECVKEYVELQILMEGCGRYIGTATPMFSAILSSYGTQNDDAINSFKSKKGDIGDIQTAYKKWLPMKNNFVPLLDKIPPNDMPHPFKTYDDSGIPCKCSWAHSYDNDLMKARSFLDKYELHDLDIDKSHDGVGIYRTLWYSILKDDYYRKQEDVVVKLFESVTDKSSGNRDNWFVVYPKVSANALWHYALTTPFQPEAFRMAKEMYDFYFNIYDYPALDSVLAQAYVYSKVSPNMLSSMDSSVDGLLTYMTKNRKGDFCRSLASGFKWIGAREFEIKVLRAMLEAGLPEMDETLQKRLKILLEPLREAPAIMASTELKTQSVSIDYAAKLWSNDDCLSFFKKLALEERALTYSLVFDEFNKTLPVANKWDYEEFAKFLCNETEKDYQGQITAENISIALLQQEGVAAVQAGVLLSPVLSKAGFDHAAVMFQATLIRQNITLKIYTLYMPPKSTERKEQENITAQAMSLKTQSNPTVNELINDMRNFICEKAEEYLNSKNAGMQY